MTCEMYSTLSIILQVRFIYFNHKTYYPNFVFEPAVILALGFNFVKMLVDFSAKMALFYIPLFLKTK